MLIQGRVSGLVFLIITVATMLFAISKSKNKLPKVRKIAGLEAITEAVGRATEMGKAVFCTPGWADITSGSAGATFAAIDIIAHVARLTAKYDTRIVVAVSYPNVYPLVEQTVQQAYLAEGKPEAYDPDMVRFTSPEQYAYAARASAIQRKRLPRRFSLASSLPGHHFADRRRGQCHRHCYDQYLAPFFAAAVTTR